MNCKGCLRYVKHECEALTVRENNCFAREMDRDKYIKEMEDIIAYNKERANPKGCTAARRSIKRVKASKAVIE